MARKFGIITTVTGVESIIIQSINKKTSVEIAEARDENGTVIDLKPNLIYFRLISSLSYFNYTTPPVFAP